MHGADSGLNFCAQFGVVHGCIVRDLHITDPKVLTVLSADEARNCWRQTPVAGSAREPRLGYVAVLSGDIGER